MIRALPIFAALLLTCCGSVRGVDVVTRAESWGRHHGRVTVGPRIRWPSGWEVYTWAGRQEPVYAPGEPHYSERAPSAEWQGGIEVAVPLYRRGE